MAFNGNEQQGFEREYFTGFTLVKVISINPTKEEKLNKLGWTKVEEELNYLGERDGVKSVRLEFHLENKEGKRFVKTVFVEDKQVTSKDGTKMQVVNKYGQVAYLPVDGSTPDNMSWYSTDGKRPAYKGEEELLAFLTAWYDVRKNNVFQFDNFAAMFNSDFKEIKSLSSNNNVGIFTGVKRTFNDEGQPKYTQVIYPKLFTRGYTKAEDTTKDGKTYKGWVNQFTENLTATKEAGSQLNIEYGKSPYTFTQVKPETLSWLEGETTNAATTSQPAF